MPHTKLGKWSVRLMGLFIILMTIFFAFVTAGQKGGDGFFDNLYLTIPVIIAGISGIFSFVIGLLAILKQRDKSLLVYISSFLGFLITLFILAEIFFPH